MEITEWLSRLGQQTPEIVLWETLTGGVSGSATYRLMLASGEAVLKVTRANSSSDILARARRERMFYRSGTLGIPLQTPQILASDNATETGCALLLRAYTPAKDATEWRQEDYLEVADELARFHAKFWNQTEALAAYDWLRPVSSEDHSAVSQEALTVWQQLRETHPQAAKDWTRAKITQALEKATHLKQASRALPLTLCHNDCHIGNLLRNGEQFVWADWQEVGIGYGSDDLSFLYQRAGTPPDRRVVRAYQERLAQETGQSVPFEAIWRGVVASELWTRLVHWPHYLLAAPEERVRYHLERVDTLLRSV